ncbi:MAG: hypothetical protein Q7R32_08150 [Dehalococcoidia bacterium]|nr:hypothetical protein [Dehalococcoidia bacterium]
MSIREETATAARTVEIEITPEKAQAMDLENTRRQRDRFQADREELLCCVKEFGHVVAGSAGMIPDRESVKRGCDFWYETALPLVRRLDPRYSKGGVE